MLIDTRCIHSVLYTSRCASLSAHLWSEVKYVFTSIMFVYRLTISKVIHSIRKANFELPPEFPAEKRPSEASIVKSLLAHNPDGRPSAQELLTSGIIPFKVEDESMRQILHSLTEPSSVHHQNVLRTLFGRPTIPLNEPFFDASLKVFMSYVYTSRVVID